MEHENVTRFKAEYAKALLWAIEARPDDYAYGADKVPLVVDRMVKAWLSGRANHSGPAHRKACKALGIPHTQTALKAWFRPARDALRAEREASEARTR